MSLDTQTLDTLAASGRLSAIANHLMTLPHPVRTDAIETVQRGLTKPQAARLNYIWPLHARDSQLPPKGDWNTWMILAGRGFGKTRTGAEWVRAQAESGQAGRIALVARTLDEAQSVMIHGESGLIEVSPPRNRPIYEPSKRKLTWPNGAFALAFSSHEPDQLRGPQFDAAWCDELASWQYPADTWDNLSFALRLGRRPRSVVTTTPRHIELVRALPNSPGVEVTRGTTFDNKDNLAPAFFNDIIDRYDGTRIGQQEIYAEIVDEDEDALWKREWIEKARLTSYPPIARIVVSIDPAMSTKPNSSETGIVVVGADMRREHAYVIADESGRLTPNSWALRATHLFDKFNATRIIAETNSGGDLVGSTLKAAIARTLPFKSIKARRGKYIRAEPVAALYEQSLPRTLIRGPSPPHRQLPPARRPDVHLEPKRPSQPLPRPRRRPRPRHHRADDRPNPSQNLDLTPNQHCHA